MECRYASDQSLLVSFGAGITLEVHHRVRRALQFITQKPIPGVINVHPAYCSVLIRFNPLLITHRELEGAIRERLTPTPDAPLPSSTVIDIPVCYGGEFGPDLESVARISKLSSNEIVQLHSSARYYVYFLGFVPGFAYLGGLPGALAVPRIESPRKSVIPGSVAIAGNQAGIYPFATPGGWRLIGRTPVHMFDAGRTPMATLAIGDEVRFRPITADEFRA